MASKSFKEVIAKTFNPGTPVEISSDDDGFRGSWYEATVVRRLKKNSKILIEYKDLMEDGGKKRLREEVDAVQLRPLPPRESPGRNFTLNEEVDCLYNDGWWEGVITKVLEDNRFAVYFRVNREQRLFSRGDIRLHREWLHDKWDPPVEAEPEDQKMSMPVKLESGEDVAQEKFSPGERVEVSSDEEGFAGAWFAATIIEKLDEDKYLIEYESLRNDEDTALLREEIDTLHIQPYPPNAAAVESFKAFEEVDALYNDGWWVGVVIEVLGNQKYNVYFNGTNEEMVFKHSDLRKHQDWTNGKWVIPSQALKLR